MRDRYSDPGALQRRAEDGGVIGDVITAVTDEAVKNLDDMLTQLGRRQPGDTVTLTVWRGGAARETSVGLAAGE